VAALRIVSRDLWRTRRAAAVAGIGFAVLMILALVMMRYALGEGGLASVASDTSRQWAVRAGLGLVPFAGIAFLWFIGVVRERLGDIEDRLFSTVFMGSGLLFLAMLFAGVVTASALVDMAADGPIDPDVVALGTGLTDGLVSGYGLRMAAVFTLSVSTLGLRTASMPRWLVLLGYAVALVLLVSPDGQAWVGYFFPGWVLVVSVALLLVDPPPGSAATPTPT
jgi:hypothetical protein